MMMKKLPVMLCEKSYYYYNTIILYYIYLTKRKRRKHTRYNNIYISTLYIHNIKANPEDFPPKKLKFQAKIISA